MSNLQWIFLVVAVTGLPMLIRERRTLLQHRLVLAALVFVITQWLSALLSAEYTFNAIKGAVRMTAAFTLLCITLCLRDGALLRVWGISAVVAALYALLDYGGFGARHLFRDMDFSFGTVKRLSGSFEYPNTAAAFFGLSLPIVWTTLQRRWIRIPAFLALWTTLVLTYSRGATIAALVVMLIWAFAVRARSGFLPVALCTAAFAALLAIEPVLIKRFRSEPAGAQSAQYRPEFNRIGRHPDEAGDLLIELENTGTETWGIPGQRPFTLTPRWYDPEQRVLIRTVFPQIPIPVPVRPHEAVAIRVPFRTPPHEGVYLLTFDISQSGTDWFSAKGVFPGLVEVHVQRSGEAWSGSGDLSRWHAKPITEMFVVAPFSRSELWTAALDMTKRHPILGVGPDNFRLLYGKTFGIGSWDTTIRSNSLYLELLSGSGLAGLTAFIFMIAAVPRTASAPVLALAILLLHGFVDDFLMTTPIYFGFWILLALGDPIKRSPSEGTTTP